jgi:hypothetical protein
VKQISTGKILIVDPDGFTRQIKVAAAPQGVAPDGHGAPPPTKAQ